MAIFNVVITDQAFSKKTGQLPLQLSSYSLPASVTTGTYIADILNVRPGLTPIVEPFYSFTVGGNAISGWTLLVGPIPPSIPVTVRLIAGGQVASYPLFPNVVSVLGTLTLSGALNSGTATSGSIIGATPGSTITSNVTGLTVDSINRTYSFNGSASASTITNGLVETLAGAVGSPKNNSVTVGSATITLQPLFFASLPSPLYIGSSASGTISGATSGSTITASGLPSGFTIDGAARTWAWSGTGSAGTSSASLTETLAGATNTPNTTSALSITISSSVVTLSAKTVTIGDSWYGNQNPPYTGFYMGTYYASHTSKKVLNLAKGGTGLDWWDTKRAEIAAAKPYIVISSFGRNDFMSAAFGGTDDATKLAAYKAKYLSCINNTKADVPGVLIICETLTEQHKTPDTAFENSYNSNRHAFNTWLFSLKTAGTIAEVIDIGGESHIGADGAMIPGTPMTVDGTHLTEDVGHPYAYTVFQPTMDGFYAAHAAPTGFMIDRAVLSNVSSGWTAGQNPPKWQSLYPNAEGYDSFSGTGDQVRARWRLDGGAWTTTAWEPLDDELATGIGVPWPFLTDGSINAGGVFDVQEQRVRDLSLGTEEFSDWSLSWTDTISAVVSLWTPNAQPTKQDHAYDGTLTPTTFANQPFGNGTAVVQIAYGGDTPATVTIGGVAMTRVAQVVNGLAGLACYVKTGVTAGNKDIVITPTAVAARTVGIAAGTLSSTLNATPSATQSVPVGFNADPQTAPNITLPAGGVALAIAGPNGSGVVTSWYAPALSDTEQHGAGGEYQAATAHVIGGASSSSVQFKADGYNYAGGGMLVVAFGP